MINIKKYCNLTIIMGFLAIMFDAMAMFNPDWYVMTSFLTFICFIIIIAIYIKSEIFIVESGNLRFDCDDITLEFIGGLYVTFWIWLSLTLFSGLIDSFTVLMANIYPLEESVNVLLYYSFMVDNELFDYKIATENLFVTVISMGYMLFHVLGVYKKLEDKNDKQLSFDFN
jgi:hypothetical protein